MKILNFLCLFMFTLNVSAQDMITKKTGEDIKAKVIEIGTADVKYKKWANQTGPIYSIAKTDILMIRYQNGQKEIFDTQITPTVAVQPTINLTPNNINTTTNFTELGKMHADKYYRGYRGAFFGSVICTGLTGPIIGLVAPVSSTFGKVKEKHMLNSTEPDELFKNPEYYNGYKKEARKIKTKKTWIGYGVGVGVSILASAMLIIATS